MGAPLKELHLLKDSRLTINLDEETNDYVRAVAREDKKPIAAVVHELLIKAMKQDKARRLAKFRRQIKTRPPP